MDEFFPFFIQNYVNEKKRYLFPCYMTYILDYILFIPRKVFFFSSTSQEVTVPIVISYIADVLILLGFGLISELTISCGELIWLSNRRYLK